MGERKQFKEFERRLSTINAYEAEMELLDDAELATEYQMLRERHEQGETLDDLLPPCFAITREMSRRVLGMRHFDVQLIGGMVLHAGAIAEMRTGEGKTLTATLPVVLNALAGRGVHLVTVNDYLARRDAEWMAPLYRALGLSVGILNAADADQPERKRQAYQADITYGTNSEFGFDYLRDNLARDKDEQVQRTPYYAIVDEVDNILIDEARTPLIVSGSPTQASDTYYRFADLARQLEVGERPDGLEAKSKHYVPDFDYEIDEKHKSAAITERGTKRAEEFLGIDNLFLAEHGSLVNHLLQALRAQTLYKRDVDYAVIDGEVKIIDEFTGRILDGRRWSEGLHQAVEAKESLAIQAENVTVATITYQNLFRRYDKLAGMTGTALTEATEFMKIYSLPVVEIPTNRTMIRQDSNDQIYKTKTGKWQAVAEAIAQHHETGQPVLVGTISVEVSELLSQMLKQRGVKHQVLNAKPEYAAREAEIVAEAGRLGAVTIATNMAGRGVDIKLGGSPEHLADAELRRQGLTPEDETWGAQRPGLIEAKTAEVADAADAVRQAGGLCIIGTERHESRRIDNQLRGRSGRQGDPGESRFYISAEDDLVRLFAGDRIYNFLDRLGPVEDGVEQPIEASMLSRQIESAQRKVEERNYLVRKHVLEYDDVMNQQREVIYAYRDSILDGQPITDQARERIAGVITRLVSEYLSAEYIEDWDWEGFSEQMLQFCPQLELDDLDHEGLGVEGVEEILTEQALAAYQAREEELGDELMRALEQQILLQIIDERWQEHLAEMDYMREGIHLRGFAQLDPLVSYKNEAFIMFEQLVERIWEEFGRFLFHAQVEMVSEEQLAGEQTTLSRQQHGNFQYQASGVPATNTEDGWQAEPAQISQRQLDERAKTGRNQPCWCGRTENGKPVKFKNCHGR
jgi:preprotein translocase subunit SecA